MVDAEIWLALGMSAIGLSFPVGLLYWLAWRDRKRQNRRGFDEST